MGGIWVSLGKMFSLSQSGTLKVYPAGFKEHLSWLLDGSCERGRHRGLGCFMAFLSQRSDTGANT